MLTVQVPTTKKRRSGRKSDIWTSPSRYGTYEGERGNPEQWAAAFNFVWDRDFAEKLFRNSTTSPWAILGVPEGSPAGVIKSAYRAKLREHHPDHGGSKEMCQKIISAYALLK